MARKLLAYWLGRRDYRPVRGLQESLMLARQEGRTPDTVLFLEHAPVITLGRGAKPEHVLLDLAQLAELGIDCVQTDRGGDVTLHAPGQLVCYPIIELSPERRDVRRYVKDLNETMRRLVADFGVGAGSLSEHIGLWVDRVDPTVWPGQSLARDPAKIGAIGVRISRWVTMHGFALNLTVDLSLFSSIVPCGIHGQGVTSLRELTGKSVEPRQAAEHALLHLAEIFQVQTPDLLDSGIGLGRPDLAEAR